MPLAAPARARCPLPAVAPRSAGGPRRRAAAGRRFRRPRPTPDGIAAPGSRGPAAGRPPPPPAQPIAAVRRAAAPAGLLRLARRTLPHLAPLALRRNKLRSALTALGVIIGVAAVIAMTEIGQGSQDRHAEDHRQHGGQQPLDPAGGGHERQRQLRHAAARRR